MGSRLYHASRAAREVFRRADEVLETKLSKLCFEGPEEELERTINQQPATFVISMAWLEALRERWSALDRKLQPQVVAGHSMGEFTAAVAAGSLEFEEGLLLVRERGRAMDEAGQENPGGMASILGLSQESVSAICAAATGDDGYIGIAGFEVIMGHAAFRDVPFVLEVPGPDKKGPDKENLDRLKAVRAELGIPA